MPAVNIAISAIFTTVGSTRAAWNLDGDDGGFRVTLGQAATAFKDGVTFVATHRWTWMVLAFLAGMFVRQVL